MRKHVTIKDIRKLSKRSQLELYGENFNSSGQVVHKSDSLQPDVVSLNENGQDQLQVKLPFDCRNRSKSLTNAIAMIRIQSNYAVPFLFRSETALLSQIKGGATLLEAEKAATNRELIIKHTLPRAKTNVCFWEITKKGYDLLDLKQPRWTSKGGFVHKFCAHRISDSYQRRGFTTKIEFHLSNGKLVDLTLNKQGETTFIEVCASWPVQKELVNIAKDFQGDVNPSELIVAVTDRKMKKELCDLIDATVLSDDNRPSVRVVLAGDLIDFIEVSR